MYNILLPEFNQTSNLKNNKIVTVLMRFNEKKIKEQISVKNWKTRLRASWFQTDTDRSYCNNQRIFTLNYILWLKVYFESYIKLEQDKKDKTLAQQLFMTSDSYTIRVLSGSNVSSKTMKLILNTT